MFSPGSPPPYPSLLGPFLGILLLMAFGLWALNRLTKFGHQQVDSDIQAHSAPLSPA